MTAYYIYAAGAFILSFVLTPLLAAWARRRGLFVPPIRSRDLHLSPVPRVGGVAIVAAFALMTVAWNLLLYYWPDSFLALPMSSEFARNLLGVVLAIALLTAVNVIDDLREVRWQVRLAAQIIAAVLVAAFGVRILVFSNPFGGEVALGAFDWLFLIVWLVSLANAINWLDGVNGLAGGVSAIALAILFFLSVSPEVARSENAMLAAVGFGAVLGFLPYNIIRAKAFLGDTGSVFLGFLIAVVAIISGGKIATAFLVLAIPLLDALIVVFNRVRSHRSPFSPDKGHLHHRLLELGMKPWQIVGLFYVISLVFGLVALNTQSIGKVGGILAAGVVMGFFVAWYAVYRRRQAAIMTNQATMVNDERKRS
jgi:UDP-GlcNAc:undecaprenyl-phosphate GlcNAc-1-phosphate transferase